jgi:membrane associated rhomboid family serine protease
LSSPEPSDIAGNERRFRVCQKCGLLTPAQVPACVECGYRSFEAIEEEKETTFLKQFIAQPTPVTYTLLTINIIIFVLMVFCGGTSNTETLRAFGAKDNVLILAGEYWRFVTPIFIHVNLIHMTFNSYALIALGPTVEKLYGSARFFIIYMFAGIVSVIGSFLWSAAMGRGGLAAGASGALFGLFGTLGVFGIRYRNDLPEIFRRGFVSRIVTIIMINLVIGYVVPRIDNAAHISGLIAGAAAALFIPYQRVGMEDKRSIWTILQLAYVALVIFCFVQAVRHYQGPPFSLQVASFPRAIGMDEGRHEKEFIEAWNGGEAAFLKSLSALEQAHNEKKEIDENSLLGTIDGGIVSISQAPRLDKETIEYCRRMKQLIIGNKELVEKQKNGTLTREDLKAQRDRFNRLNDEFCAWAKGDGRIACEPPKTE